MLNRHFLCVLTLCAALFLSACSGQDQTDIQVAQSAFESGKYPEARLHFIAHLKEQPGDGDARLLYARTLEQLGDGYGMLSALEKLEQDPKLAPIAASYVPLALNLNKQYHEVIRQTESTKGLPAKLAARMINARIMALEALERHEEGRALIDRALAQYPEDRGLAQRKAEHFLDEGEIVQAAAVITRIRSEYPDDPDLMILAGRIARLEGRLDESMRLLQKAVKTRPVHTGLLSELAENHWRRANNDKALALYKQVLELAPDDVEAQICLAEILLATGEEGKAFEMLQKNTRDIEALPRGMRLSGLIYEKRGNHETALGKLILFNLRSPGDPQAVAALTRIYQKKGARGKAQIASLQRSVAERAEQEAKARDHMREQREATLLAAADKQPQTQTQTQLQAASPASKEQKPQ